MEDKLIKTDTVWYKIKTFFKKIFKKDEIEINVQHEDTIQNEKKENFISRVSVRDELEKQNQKEEFAEKLRNGELDVDNLTDDQIDEMTEYFEKDIEEIDKELLRINEHIASMEKKLANM